MFGARVLWPEPVILPAAFGSGSKPTLPHVKFDSWDAAKLVFREDTFDPVSRIRRGRFYIQHGGQPNGVDWHVIIAPPVKAYQSEVDEKHPDMAKKSVYTYQSYMVTTELKKAEYNQVLVALGRGNALTSWTIINVELTHNGEELVTLKSRQSLGALPEVFWSRVPEDSRSIVREKLDGLENDFRRAGAESIVDRAREAATAILSAHLQDQGANEAKGMDLGDLVQLLVKLSKKHQNRIMACAAEIPQRLHSRAKHAEQEKRENLPPIREQDAELSVLCVGTILRDLGWAEWR